MALNIDGMIRFTYSVSDDVGPVNPSTATLTIERPDGTLQTGIVIDTTPAVTGQLVYDYQPPAQYGRYVGHWKTTGPNSGDDDVFWLAEPGAMLVGVDAAINHLRAAGVITSTASRETIQDLCLVATDAIERDLDRTLVRRTFTETYSGVNGPIQLRHTPVLAITSVTVGGSLLLASQYLLDGSFLYYGSTTGYSSWTAGLQNVVVTYQAGYANPPWVARQAALTLIQCMWQQSQQAFHPALDESSAEAFVGSALPMLGQIPGYNALRSMAVA